MDKPVTIYFDTNFFVALGRERKESDALQAIDDLNDLNVRYVVSDLLKQELLAGDNRTGNDAQLVKCVNRFKHPPYCIAISPELEALSHSGDERKLAADIIQNMQMMVTYAESLSIMAGQNLPPEKRAKVNEAIKPVLESFGFPDPDVQDIRQSTAAVGRMLKTFGVDCIDLPEEITPDNVEGILDQFKDLIGRDQFEQQLEGDRIRNSSTKNDDRAYQVVINTADADAAWKLGGLLRDTEHINIFVTHQHEIDFLQVDKTHHNIIYNAKPRHRILELGLGDRVFFATNLKMVVDKVRVLCEHQKSKPQN